jgi:hypothetical protein
MLLLRHSASPTAAFTNLKTPVRKGLAFTLQGGTLRSEYDMFPVHFTTGIVIFNCNPPRMVTAVLLRNKAVLNFHINHVRALPDSCWKGYGSLPFFQFPFDPLQLWEIAMYCLRVSVRHR